MKRALLLSAVLAAAPALACDISKVRVSPDGFGMVKTGMTVPEAAKATSGAVVVNEESLGITEGCHFADFREHGKEKADSGLSFMVEADKITTVHVRSNGFIKTAEGAHVGMQAEQVKKIYDGKWQKKDNIYGSDGAYKIFVPLTETRGYMFECADSCKDGEKITAIAAGELQSVQYAEGCL